MFSTHLNKPNWLECWWTMCRVLVPYLTCSVLSRCSCSNSTPACPLSQLFDCWCSMHTAVHNYKIILIKCSLCSQVMVLSQCKNVSCTMETTKPGCHTDNVCDYWTNHLFCLYEHWCFEIVITALISMTFTQNASEMAWLLRLHAVSYIHGPERSLLLKDFLA